MTELDNNVAEVSDIDELALALERAKQAEKEARDKRVSVEDALIAKVGAKEEGTTSAKTDYYTVKTVGKITRTLDQKKVAALAKSNLGLIERFTRTKLELDTTAYKKLASADPDAYKLAARAVVAKPAKTSVSVERIEG